MAEKEKQEELGEGFSSIDLVSQCLIDEEKFNAFETVLKNVVNENSSVVDLGTGSGILAMLAGRLGAKEVTAVEFDPYIADVARKNIKQNNLDPKVKVITGDARNIKFPQIKKFDIVIMEMLATGLVDEMQVQATNNLLDQKLIDQNTVVVPFAQENYIALAETNFSIYGFDMKMVRHLWSHDNGEDLFNLASDKVLLNKINFSQKNEELFKKELTFKIKRGIKVNSLCLTSKVLVDRAEKITLAETHSLNPIVLIPLPERVVRNNDEIKIYIEYQLSGGFKNFKADFID